MGEKQKVQTNLTNPVRVFDIPYHITNLSCLTVNAQTRVSGCKNTSDDLYESIYPSLDLRLFITCALEKQFGSFGTLIINEAFF